MTEPSEYDRQKLVECLLQPGAYSHETGGYIEHVSTHISDIFLAGDFAYKVKKPVDFGFCDFSTPELRQKYSERELELNQRLSQDVYLSVEPVNVAEADQFNIGGPGKQVEHALKMRRLTSSDQLDQLLSDGKAGEQEIRQIARLLADFHGRAESAPPEFGTVDAVSKIVLGNLDRVFEHARPELDRLALANVAAYSKVFLAERRHLIERRRKAGKPRMCHGDLHAGNIFLEETATRERQVQIIDCIEFNDNFVYIDPTADLAFLSMDLKRLGHDRLADLLVEEYAATANDTDMLAVLPFYESYRAMVRCMASSIMAGQSTEERDRRKHTELANDYLALACKISAQDRPQFLGITAGMTGTGKSTVAKLIAGAWNVTHLQTDVIRRELAGIGLTERSGSQVSGGIYTKEMSVRTYEEMHLRAAKALADGQSVIMDGTHLRKDFRRESLNVGRNAGVSTIIIECTLDEQAAINRLQRRYASGESESEGRPEVYERQSKHWQPVSDDESDAVARVRTDGDAARLPNKIFKSAWTAALRLRP